MAGSDDRKAAEQFLDSANLSPLSGTLAGLGECAEAFSRLPYENISKILKTGKGNGPDDWRRQPLEVIDDHLASGLGGTCFALTELFRQVVARLGFDSRPVMADTPAGQNHHCALLVRHGEQDYLVDPGYLICTPVAIPDDKSTIATARGSLELTKDRRDGRLILSEVADGKLRYRLDPKPVDDATFRRHWNASFDWSTMHQLLVTQFHEGRQLYLHNRHFRIISSEKIEKHNIGASDLEQQIAGSFGIDAGKVAEARTLLNARRTKRKI